MFNIGDKVKVVKSKKGTYGISLDRFDNMKDEVFTIEKVCERGDGEDATYMLSDGLYIFPEWLLKSVDHEEIHITRKENVVHAIYKFNGEVTRRSKAICAPSDEFDFLYGAKLAIERLESVSPPKFNFDDFMARKFVVHCEKSPDRAIFLAYLHGKGARWNSGSSLVDSSFNSFQESIENICYFGNNMKITCDRLEYCKGRHTPVIPFCLNDL